MEEFKRKLIILECIVLLLVVGVSYILINGSKELEKPKEENKEMLAMYLEDESGAFQISNSKTFPKEGYLLDHAECKNGGEVTQNPETKKISVSFSHTDSCNLYFVREKLSFSETLIAKANDISVTDYSSGNMGEMYTFDHEEVAQTTGWSTEERRDYRYIGANPNNWVKFNDEDWRIIGVFTTEVKTGEDASGNSIYEKQQLIKIIRNESIVDIDWDANGVNEWSSSSLKTLLNTGDYYNRANTYASTGLNKEARSQIEEVRWYLGGYSTTSGLGGPAYYSFERGETTCVTTGKCSGETRSTNTIGKVGLMYPSDYVYTYANGVDNKCYTDGYNCKINAGATPNNGWLYNSNIAQWTISPYTSNAINVLYVIAAGYVSNIGATYSRAVRPVVYLKSDIKIISGDGASSETAYQLN